MPVPNDLTDEENAMFAEHGAAIPPAAGGDTSASVTEVTNESASTATPPATPPATPVRDPATGKFVSADGTQTETPPAASEQTDDNRMVPHAALHAERERTKAMQAQMRTLMARASAVLAQQANAATNVEGLPDMNEDPVGYLEAIGNRLTQAETSRAETARDQQIDAAIAQDETAFALSQPDYEDAAKHYASSRIRELHFMGMQPAQIEKTLNNEARQIAQQAWNTNRSMGETVYALAQARGYTPATGPSPTPTPPATGVTPPPTPAPSAADVVAAANAAKQASGLGFGGSGGGGGAPAPLSAEQLLAMSDEDFEKHLALGSKGADARFGAIAGR